MLDSGIGLTETDTPKMFHVGNTWCKVQMHGIAGPLFPAILKLTPSQRQQYQHQFTPRTSNNTQMITFTGTRTCTHASGAACVAKAPPSAVATAAACGCGL